MNTMELLKKVYAKVNNKAIFDEERQYPSRQAQDAYLARFEATSDHYANSYNKYECICFFYYSKARRALYNAVSALMYYPLYFRLKRNKKDVDAQRDDRLLVVKRGKTIGIDDIFPGELRRQYNVKEVYIDYSKAWLDPQADQILQTARKKHPLAFHYQLVAMIRLATQSWIINTYQPALVCTYVCEREFADPLLTLYSQRKQVEYHGFMHGDYLYQIDHAFLQYSCYWVWDEHYKKGFEALKCTQPMRVYRPGKYTPLVAAKPNERDYPYFATYYMSGETKEESNRLLEVFEALRKKGKRCKLRPHPRFSNIEYLKSLFTEYDIEDCSQYTLKQSLEDTYYCVAINSTVLSQAFYSGKKAVIDDVTNPEKYAKLFDDEYIMLEKTDLRLSALLAEVCGEKQSKPLFDGVARDAADRMTERGNIAKSIR